MDDTGSAGARSGPPAWRDHPSFGMAVGFLAVIVAVLGVGVALGVLMLGAVGEVQEEVREVRRDVREVRGEVEEVRAEVGELRERMVRVESKLEVLAGEWPPPAEAPPGQ